MHESPFYKNETSKKKLEKADARMKTGLLQLMSRRGNCAAAPLESFFGYLKDEVDYQEVHNLCELKEITGE